jgi:hypothetical protein
MISYDVYRLIHFLGIFLLLTALGGAAMRAMLSVGVPTSEADRKPVRRLVAATHGVALLLILVGGFGMLARLEIGFPGWIVAKLLVWLALGAMVALIGRLAGRARMLWFAIPVLAFIAGWLALTKPL